MCISMAAVSAISAVASAGLGVIGAYQQSQATKAQANFKAQEARNNATIAMQNAERLQQYGIISDAEMRKRIAATKAAATARLAANGLLADDTVDSTGALLRMDLVAEGEYDILKLADRYAQQVYAAKVQGVNYQAESGLASLNQPSPGFSATGSLLSSAGKVYGAGKEAKWWGGGGTAFNSYNAKMSIMDI